ncbi:MAG: glycosyltransferase [Lachnospiraceae bacterium]|nr:glycosyltransferase [Lachnospiraceae bacterium]
MLLSVANLKKTINYLKKNGLEDTYYAALERIVTRKQRKYQYEQPAEEELERQVNTSWSWHPKLSLVVPAYETKPIFMQDLLLSVVEQTYRNYELVIADASETDVVEKVVKDFQTQYEGIVYVRLEGNGGISDNTNAALDHATGEYIGLLDHDDLLTPDALYYVAKELEKCQKKKRRPELLYTDEDKTNEYLEVYYEPNKKRNFNYDLILTNNYICHLTFYRADIIRKLGLRKEYDGAQDYDLVLRTMALIEDQAGEITGTELPWEDHIRHIPHILYHWRCHEESTALNTASKAYAYEAGKRALEDYVKGKNWDAKVSHLKHLGFYRIEYGENTGDEDNLEMILRQRGDLGVIGGAVYRNHKISGGAMRQDGAILYKGLHERFSGYLNRGVLQQDVDAVDLRNMTVRKDLISLFEKTTGFSYPVPEKYRMQMLSEEEMEKIRKKSLDFCNKVRKKNIGILYDPFGKAK